MPVNVSSSDNIYELRLWHITGASHGGGVLGTWVPNEIKKQNTYYCIFYYNILVLLLTY